MTATTTEKGLEALRKPFPSAVIGKLPKQGVPGGLDYVGHAAVTDRLLSVDPNWSWEPLALDEHGLPLYDRGGNLWIKLTVCGVTRLGVGDGPDPKQRISDALRNAAMRFGVALDLWTKGELESQDPNGGGGDTVRQHPPERPARPPAVEARADLWTYAQTIGYTSTAALDESYKGWSSGGDLARASVEDVRKFRAFLESERAA